MVKLNRKILRYTLTVVVVLLALALGGFGNYWYTLSTYHSSKGQNPFEKARLIVSLVCCLPIPPVN